MVFLHDLWLAFKTNYKLLLLASLPALALTAFGLYQLEAPAAAWAAALPVRLLIEFVFLGAGLALLVLLGVKNKWLPALLLYVYYLACTADFVLLWYFKERFGAKYLDTLQGGDYAFLTDWRTLSYLLVFLLFCFFIVRRFFIPPARKTAAKQLGACAAVLLVLWLFNPLALLPKPYDFLTTYLMPPSPVYTLRAVLAKHPQALITGNLPANIADTARKYNVFTAKNTGAGKEYKRVILIATESLSAKYLHRFNPLIPPAASAAYDRLFEVYPSATLHTVTLSTLYGLTVIFSSHPYAELNYENGYPLSFVKELKKYGFRTAFLRGADETYMDENLLFHQAGFDEVLGSRFFSDKENYKDYIDWWGLTDRKLFEYAAEYLQEHKDEKTFLTLLTVDTHVPLGRLDYLDQPYEEIDARFYDVPTMPRAYARAAQDLNHFLHVLEEKGLFDEDTLIFVTGDHPSYSNTPTNKLFKPYQRVFDRIPFAVITKTPIKQPLTQDRLASQLDIAPTVMDLLNLPQPKGFFGHSLFDQQEQRSIFDVKEDYVAVSTEGGTRVLPLNSSKAQDREIIDLIRTFWTEE